MTYFFLGGIGGGVVIGKLLLLPPPSSLLAGGGGLGLVGEVGLGDGVGRCSFAIIFFVNSELIASSCLLPHWLLSVKI